MLSSSVTSACGSQVFPKLRKGLYFALSDVHPRLGSVHES